MNLVSRHNAELTALCRRFGVRRLELFGSVATGRDDSSRSDVDFLVEFETLPDGTYADTYFGLLESLEALLQRPVDLVVATAITNPYFRKSVDDTKTWCMRLESKKYLRDVERAAQLAGEFLIDKTFDNYASTPMLRAAVERQCEIIGEALAQLARTDAATAAQVREYRRIIAFRNILIHGYAEVDHHIVWEVATVKVSALAADVRALLEAAEGPNAL